MLETIFCLLFGWHCPSGPVLEASDPTVNSGIYQDEAGLYCFVADGETVGCFACTLTTGHSREECAYAMAEMANKAGMVASVCIRRKQKPARAISGNCKCSNGKEECVEVHVINAVVQKLRFEK